MNKTLTNEMVLKWARCNPDKKTFEIDSGITSIGHHAFKGTWKQIEHIIMPDSIEEIEQMAFRGLKIKEIKLSKNLKKIAWDAFYSCSEIEEINFPDGLEEISNGAFSGCVKLKNVNLPLSLKIVGKDAFLDCDNINEINHPCLNITRQFYINNCNKELESYLDKSADHIHIPESVTKIGDRAFSNCVNLKEITIPSSVVELGEGIFYNCTSLKKVIIPSSITKICDGTFANCTSLKKIIIPDSVTSIENHAFSGCINLEEVELPQSLTSWRNNIEKTIPFEERLLQFIGQQGDFTFEKCLSLSEETKKKLKNQGFDIK